MAEKKAELHRREAGVKSAAHPNKETRTVEELLSFIQEERQGQAKKQGKKKRAKKKKEASREHSLDTERSSESKLSGQGQFADCKKLTQESVKIVKVPATRCLCPKV